MSALAVDRFTLFATLVTMTTSTAVLIECA